MSDFGLRLQTLRKQRGLTQRMLAERINKSLSAVSSYETNAQMPPLDVLISIASVLNVSLDILAGLDRRNILVIDNFPIVQKELLQLLVKEFTSPTSQEGGLSLEQKEILDKLLYIFYGKK